MHEPEDVRICFFGDSFVNGTGDDACLGWVGRVCAAARHRGLDLTGYNLGIRRDTSADVAARWMREAEARLPPECDGRLVFAFGANDCASDPDGAPRLEIDRVLANAEAILAAARAWRPTLMVGPLPILDDRLADARIARLSSELRRLCERLSLPYFDALRVASCSAGWRDEAAASDGSHPNERGYAELAGAIDRWPVWRRWLVARPAGCPGDPTPS